MLRVAVVDRKAASYAVRHWHYSGKLPSGKLLTLGVWEDERFIGAVVFGLGNSGSGTGLGGRYGLTMRETVELARVALRDHTAPVTQIVADSLRLLKQTNPGVRLVISFADPEQGHIGTIYQAGNWIHDGWAPMQPLGRVDGRWVHSRTYGVAKTPASSRRGMVIRRTARKPRYLYPMDRKMRRQIEPLALPYPTAADIAEQVSEARRHPSGVEGRVQSPGSAP